MKMRENSKIARGLARDVLTFAQLIKGTIQGLKVALEPIVRHLDNEQWESITAKQRSKQGVRPHTSTPSVGIIILVESSCMRLTTIV